MLDKTKLHNLKKIIEANIPSPEEMISIRHENIEKCPFVPSPGEFNYTSLLKWLEVCKMVGVSHVPGESIFSISIEDLWGAADGKQSQDLKDMFSICRDKVTKDTMVRYDCCAPQSLKAAMSEGAQPHIEDRLLDTYSELRLFDIIYYWIPEKLDIVLRPWVKAKYENNYPVEFRVFVQDDIIIGASNYYPQMGLPKTYIKYAKQSMEITKKLVGTTPSFTADYILTEDQELVYLEGGPPHHVWGGAHMCCFKPGRIKGIALTNRRNHL